MDAPSNFVRTVAVVAIALIVAASLCVLDGDDPQQDLCYLLLLVIATVLAAPLVLPGGGDVRAWPLPLHPPLVPARHRPAPI